MKKTKDMFWTIEIIVLVLIAIVVGMHKHITSFVNLPDNVDRIIEIIAIVGIVVVGVAFIISSISYLIKRIESRK